ncbi:MAG: hypothetical protein ACFE0I_22940 [Elainellaceae cyanobacterium]
MANKRSAEASKSATQKSANKSRVRFIFEPDRSSPNGITFSWLVHNAYNGKEKAATATRAFWLPFAYRDSGNYSEDELRELAQQSIWRLEEQIQHLRESFGLEIPNRSAVTSPVFQEKMVSSNASIGDAIAIPSFVEDAPQGLTSPAENDILNDFAEAL